MNRRALILTASALSLSACAPLAQRPEVATLGFRGPRLVDDVFVSFDGARLGLMRWLPAGEPDWVVVGLHGMNDYANAYHLAPYIRVPALGGALEFIGGLASAVRDALGKRAGSVAPACGWRCGAEWSKCPRREGAAA
jgi:hypothetical protein